jgi:hypothetical protein
MFRVDGNRKFSSQSGRMCVRSSDSTDVSGTRLTLNQQKLLCGNGSADHHLGKAILYIMRRYQLLRGQSMLVMGH